MHIRLLLLLSLLPGWAAAQDVDRWRYFGGGAFGPRQLFYESVGAGFDQLRGFPEGWSFSKRAQWHALTGFTGVAIEHGLAAATGERAGFQPCACRGAGPRFRHVFAETFRKRSIAASYGAAFVGAPLLPGHRTLVLDGLHGGSLGLAIGTGRNTLNEFWPEIRRTLHLHWR